MQEWRDHIVDHIEESARIIKPPNAEEYPYEPYEFANMEEVTLYKKKADNEFMDSLYERAKSIVRNYNDQDDYKLILLGVDTVWSYYQDKFSTTHYVGVIGDNGSGKSTVGDTFEAVGYHVQIKRYIPHVLSEQLIEVRDNPSDSPTVYATTEKGRVFLEKYVEVQLYRIE